MPTVTTRQVPMPATAPAQNTATFVEQLRAATAGAQAANNAATAARLSATPRAEQQAPPPLERWVSPGTLSFMREVPASLLTRMAIRQEFNLLPPKSTAAVPLTFEVLRDFLIEKFRSTSQYKNQFALYESYPAWDGRRIFNHPQPQPANPAPPTGRGAEFLLVEEPTPVGNCLEPDGAYLMRNIRVEATEHGSCREYRASCNFNGELRIPRDVVLAGAAAVREFITENLSHLRQTTDHYIYAHHQPRRLSSINPSFDTDAFTAAVSAGPRRV